MSYVISVPASSIQKAATYGANVTIISTGISFADGTTVTAGSTSSSYPIDFAYRQANVATGIASASYTLANTTAVKTQAVFDYANTLTLGAAIDAFARANTVALQNVNVLQNTIITIIQGVDDGQNTRMTINDGVNIDQNTRLTVIENTNLTQNTNIASTNGKMQSAYNQANTGTVLAQAAFNSANNVAPQIQPSFNQANTGLVLAQAAFDYANSRQNIQSTASPTFNSLLLTNALAISQGGTGATSQGAALTSLLPTGTSAGYVLTTGGPGSFYWAAGSGGGSGGVTPGTTIASTRVSATGNGTGLAYSTPVYIPGASQLRVYINGVRQFASEYTETSGNTAGSGIVTFSASPASGSAILFEVDGYTNNPYYANNIAFTVNANISSTANTIQLAIDGLASKVAYTSGATFTGSSSVGAVIGSNRGTALSVSGSNASSPFVAKSGPYATVWGILPWSGGQTYMSSGTYYDNSTWIHASDNTYNCLFTIAGLNGATWYASNNSTPSWNLASGTVLWDNTGIWKNAVSTTGSVTAASFSGAGTGLTGTASSLSIGGNAATATTAASATTAGSATVATVGNSVLVTDSRASATTPQTINQGVVFDFKQNSTDGLSDGGTYFGEMTFRQYGSGTDWSGGSSHQLGFTDNGNIWQRSGSSTSWGSWKKLLDTTNSTTTNIQYNSLGVGTAASGTAGEIRATNEITAYYSDDRLKTKLGKIENALDKICSLEGFYYEANQTAQDLGYKVKREVGISAQDTQKVLPEIVKPAPIDEKYLTISYEKFAPLFVEAIKELRNEIQEIKDKLK